MIVLQIMRLNNEDMGKAVIIQEYGAVIQQILQDSKL